MTKFTQTELLSSSFANRSKGVLEGNLKQGLYILGAGPKLGKSMICTELANAVAKGSKYMGMDNLPGKVFYFDNDNYADETQDRVNALGCIECDQITYFFDEDANSFSAIKKCIEKVEDINDYSLVIVDSLANIEEYIATEDDYKSMYELIKSFRDFIVEKHLVCIALHHNKKGEIHGQDSLIGSKALSGATTGTIILNVKDEFSTTGTLDFILRSKKLVIPIQKDFLGISWMKASENEVEETIPADVLAIINKVALSKDHKIEGRPQEIVAKCKIEINPKGLSKFLKKNKKYFDENNIQFSEKRQSYGMMITIEMIEN